MLDLAEGLRVLDLCDERGEVASWLLARLGASVIKVEPPGGCASRRSDVVDGCGADEQGQSLRFNAYNHDKHSIVLDSEQPEDRATFHGLAIHADIIFDCSAAATDSSGAESDLVTVPGRLQSFGFDPDWAENSNRPVVSVLVTPFGRSGPRATQPSSELTIAALGGPVRVQGSPDRPPVTISVPQVWRHTGAEAAVAALVGRARALESGRGQSVDVSAQSVMTWTLLNAMEASQIQGYDFERTGATLELAMSINLRHPAEDGWVILVPSARTLATLVPQMIADGTVDENWLEEEWGSWDQRVIDGEHCRFSPDDVDDAVDTWTKLRTKAELLDLGQELGVTIAPINTVEDLLRFDQLDARSFWDDEGDYRRPGNFLTVDEDRGRPSGTVPGIDADGDAIRAGQVWPLTAVNEPADPARSAGSASDPVSSDLPFAGLKVADFSWIGVGPITAKCLADHGATVVRVESENRIDGLRVQPPFKDGKFGPNRSNFYGTFNTSKLSMAADLKTETGRTAARSLIEWADVVIDSFTPGTMGRLGFGADDIKAINPSAITITTSLLGSGGPRSTMAGYGYHAAALAGYFELVGYPDGPPEGPWLAYTDTIGPRLITPAVLTALERRARTGEGCHIEAAQLEIAIQFLAPELADQSVNGQTCGRRGNRDPRFVPQGLYPCAGNDTWVALTVENDDDWKRLREVMGDPDWTRGAALSARAGRAVHADAIDTAIAQWTATGSEDEIEARLRAAGLAAGKVQRSSDLAVDPQYEHRHFYHVLDHTECGPTVYAGHQYRITDYHQDNSDAEAIPHGPRHAAPCLGEHTFEVLTEHVGLDVDTVAGLAAGGGLE